MRLIVELKSSKFEQDPLNIIDFLPQNVTFCLSDLGQSDIIKKSYSWHFSGI